MFKVTNLKEKLNQHYSKECLKRPKVIFAPEIVFKSKVTLKTNNFSWKKLLAIKVYKMYVLVTSAKD